MDKAARETNIPREREWERMGEMRKNYPKDRNSNKESRQNPRSSSSACSLAGGGVGEEIFKEAVPVGLQEGKESFCRSR